MVFVANLATKGIPIDRQTNPTTKAHSLRTITTMAEHTTTNWEPTSNSTAIPTEHKPTNPTKHKATIHTIATNLYTILKPSGYTLHQAISFGPQKTQSPDQ